MACIHPLRPYPQYALIPSIPAPLVSHLDAQLNTMRQEISTLYRTQAAAQNKQLALSDVLRDRDEEVRGLREEVRQLRDAREALARRDQNNSERLRVKDDDAKVSRTEACRWMGWGSRTLPVLVARHLPRGDKMRTAPYTLTPQEAH